MRDAVPVSRAIPTFERLRSDGTCTGPIPFGAGSDSGHSGTSHSAQNQPFGKAGVPCGTGDFYSCKELFFSLSHAPSVPVSHERNVPRRVFRFTVERHQAERVPEAIDEVLMLALRHRTHEAILARFLFWRHQWRLDASFRLYWRGTSSTRPMYPQISPHCEQWQSSQLG